MRIERLNKCCGSRGNLSAVDFQPHSQQTNIHRIATSGGTFVQIWAISNPEDDPQQVEVKCVLLFTYKDHSPYDVTTLRWSPNGHYLASTDSGGITNILKRNDSKTEAMEKIIQSKLSGEALDISDSYTETTQIKKYTIKYDGTEQKNKNDKGIQRISLNSKNVQVESKEVKSDNLNLMNQDNPEGNMESWEVMASMSCPNNMGQLFDISWAPDNRSIIGGGMNGHVIVFDIHTKEIVAKFDALENTEDSPSGRGYIKSVAWDPMTLFVAVQSSNKEISVWRRSPPLPPGSPMKWTFKRVLYTDHFSEKSNTDVLGGSRVSWAPNGKNVVFPNSCINNHNFSTSYQIQHNTSNFSNILNKSNYDKNQAQYHFDTTEHTIDRKPLLLRGHNSRIRNVRFSQDIMKSSQNENQNQEKYMLMAQSSDDNMLSVWRYKVNANTEMKVECICVLKNLLDEQSSIEDLSWGDFGRCLAVASSQGGLILIQFKNEETGTKFYTNRVQGLQLKEMNQPTENLFEYAEYINNLTEDPQETQERTHELNKNGIARSSTNGWESDIRTSKIGGDDIGCRRGEIQCFRPNPVNNTGSVQTVIKPEEFIRAFLVICYRIYIIVCLYNRALEKCLRGVKRPLERDWAYEIRVCHTFYLFNVKVDQEDKNGNPKKKNKVTKKSKTVPLVQECVTDIWLDMDYGKENKIVNQYWNENEIVNDGAEKENEETNNNSNEANEEMVKDSMPKNDKPMKQARPSKSEKLRSNKLNSSNMFKMYKINNFQYETESLFTVPSLKATISVSNEDQKIIGINFLKKESIVKSSLTSIYQREFRVCWSHNLKRGYITNIRVFRQYVGCLSQKIEENRSYLTVVSLSDGEVKINEVELSVGGVTMFDVVTWSSPYFIAFNSKMVFALYKYEEEGRVKLVANYDLSHINKNNILKAELVNSSENCKNICKEKLKGHGEECSFYRKYEDVTEMIVLVVYKMNKTVSIFAKGEEEREFNADLFEVVNDGLKSEGREHFSLNSLFRFYNNEPDTDLFGGVEFEGSLSSIIESFSVQYERKTVKGGVRDTLDTLKLKLEGCILLGSSWEYVRYLYEYIRELFDQNKLEEVIDFVSNIYKTVLSEMNLGGNSEDQRKCGKEKLYRISEYKQLVPYCLLIAREFALPNINLVQSEITSEPKEPDQSTGEDLKTKSSCTCLDEVRTWFDAKIRHKQDYKEDEKRALSEKILNLAKDVQIWEKIVEFGCL